MWEGSNEYVRASSAENRAPVRRFARTKPAPRDDNGDDDEADGCDGMQGAATFRADQSTRAAWRSRRKNIFRASEARCASAGRAG
jgi:hypothetical protein